MKKKKMTTQRPNTPRLWDAAGTTEVTGERLVPLSIG